MLPARKRCSCSVFSACGNAWPEVATILLAVFGTIMLDLGRRLDAESHLPVIHHAGGRWIGRFIDWTIISFLFGGFVAMGAGSEAIFVEQFNLPFILGTVLMAGLSLVTVLLGFSGVITSISFVVPLLRIAILGVSILTIAADPAALLSSVQRLENTRGGTQ